MNHRLQHLLQPYGGLFAGCVTMLVALGIYWLTLARDLTWANYGVDGGDLITAVVTRGNPHPSGYPLYLLLGYLVERLPLTPIAFRFNLFSALSMALGAGFVTATALSLTQTQENRDKPRHYLIAITTGLTLAFSALIWGQAIITEVYGLFLLLSAAYLWSLLTNKPAWITGFICGLAITAHSTGWLLLPLAIILTPRKKLILLAIGLLIGLLPFVLLPLLGSPASPVIWGNLDTIQGWWWLVSGQIYRGYVFSLPQNLWLTRLSDWGIALFTQFTWAGIPLIIVAFFVADPKLRRLYWLLLGTAILYFIIAFFYHTDDAIVFTLPAWVLLSLLFVPVFQRLGWIALALPLALILLNFQSNNLKDDHLVRHNVESLLLEVPENTILETPGDPTIFALWYIIFAEEQRSDIIPVDSDLFAFDWYRNRLQLLYPDLTGLEHDNLTEFRELNQARRAYCFASLAQKKSNSPYSLVCTENTHS